jgi:hypothetical protein
LVNFPPSSGQSLVIDMLPFDNLPATRTLPTKWEARTNLSCSGASWTTNPTPQHIQLVVADGPFLLGGAPDDAGDARKAYADWTVILQCMGKSQ